MNAQNSITIAGLDYGSNSLRLLIASLDGADTLLQVYRDRVEIRLASDAFKGARFTSSTRQSLIDTSKRYSQKMTELNVSRYRAVGTEAFRRTVNAPEITEEVFRQTGIQIEIIDSADEADIIRQAVNHHCRSAGTVDLIVDLGGGSLELISDRTDLEGEQMLLESHPLGLAALLASFLETRSPGLDARREMRIITEKIGRELHSDLVESKETRGTIALTGGQAEMIDHLALQWDLWNENESKVSGITLEQLEAICSRLVIESTDRLIQLGVSRERALMIPGAAAFYLEICRRRGAKSILLPSVGLIDGLLFQMDERGRNWSIE